MHFSPVVRFKPLALEGRHCLSCPSTRLSSVCSEQSGGKMSSETCLDSVTLKRGVKLYHKILYDINCINTTKVP